MTEQKARQLYKEMIMQIDNAMRLVSKEQKEATLWGKPWTHGADVMATWKRNGFVPPTEYRNDYKFKVNREAVDD
jgi:hypothetical protein